MQPEYVDLIGKLALGILTMFTMMVGLLVWLIKQQNGQVQTLTKEFTSTLSNTVTENTKAHSHTAEILVTVTGGITELTTTLREMMSTNREEHRALMQNSQDGVRVLQEAIGRVIRTRHEDNNT